MGFKMSAIYKKAQDALNAKDYNSAVLTMLQQDYDYIIGTNEYLVSVYNHKNRSIDCQLRTNEDELIKLF